MPQAKCHAGNNNCLLCAVLGDNGLKEKAPKKYLLQEAHTQHVSHIAEGTRQREIDCHPIPQVFGNQQNQRKIPEKPCRGQAGPAKAVPLHQPVFLNPAEQDDGQDNAERRVCRAFDADHLAQRKGSGLGNAVDHNPKERKGELTFFVQLFHHFVSPFSSVANASSSMPAPGAGPLSPRQTPASCWR